MEKMVTNDLKVYFKVLIKTAQGETVLRSSILTFYKQNPFTQQGWESQIFVWISKATFLENKIPIQIMKKIKGNFECLSFLKKQVCPLNSLNFTVAKAQVHCSRVVNLSPLSWPHTLPHSRAIWGSHLHIPILSIVWKKCLSAWYSCNVILNTFSAFKYSLGCYEVP